MEHYQVQSASPGGYRSWVLGSWSCRLKIFSRHQRTTELLMAEAIVIRVFADPFGDVRAVLIEKAKFRVELMRDHVLVLPVVVAQYEVIFREFHHVEGAQ